MNEHGILFLKQNNVGKAHRRNYAATSRRFSVIFALVCFLMGNPPLSALADEKEAAPVKRVLVLNSYHPNYEWGRSVMGGIESVFDNTDIDVLCSYEYMDTKHHQPHIIFELLKELYSKKYAGFKFDVIIAADNNALDFLLAYRDTLFPGSPVVFCGITGFSESMIMGHWGFTGILENYDIKGTIEMALAIHPETRNIAVISGVSTSSRIHQDRFMQVMPAFKERVNFIDLTRLDVPQLTNRLAKLPAHTIILYLAYYKTPNGTFLAVSESTSLVLKHSGRPAYSMWEHTLGNGIVGGMMLSGDVQGRKAAEYALKILKGAAIETLPVTPESDVSPVFDYAMLKRFNIPQSKLPKNAVIRNVPQTLYYRYKYLIWAFVALAFYQSFTIFTLRRNLGKRKQAEEDLAESRAQLKSILTSMQDIVFVFDRQGVFTECYAPKDELILPLDSFIGKRHSEVMPPDIDVKYAEAFDKCKEGQVAEYDYKLEVTGETKWYAAKFSPMRFADDFTGCVAVIRDITDRKRAEDREKQLESQLLHSQKMEAIGTFAGGIAHDLNNILGAITTCSEMSLLDTPQDTPVFEDLQHVLHAANRGKNLIRHILAFSRKKDQERQPIHVKSILKECLELLEHVIPACIKIEVNSLSDTSIVLADPNKLLQVIMNLCTNAEQAMRGQNGILTIALDRVMISKDAPQSVLELKPGSYVRLSVADTGSGMDPSVLNRIFEPFYTTRRPSEGTGLGLSVAHGIIKGYGGIITVESAPAKGSTFNVYLPTVDEETLTTRLPAAASLQTGNERILLVDDDTDMLYSIKKLLERLGYAVVSCLESGQALETFRKDPDGYSLIIADQIMPSMTGLQLSKEISKCRPNIPIILCSGVLDERSVEVSTKLLQNNGIAAFIHKPFSMVEISQVIRRVFRCGETPNSLKEPEYGQSSDHR